MIPGMILNRQLINFCRCNHCELGGFSTIGILKRLGSDLIGDIIANWVFT
jgi:hypothetical protein